MENQIGIAKIDTSGKLKWKRKSGKQKNHNVYFAGTITATASDILSSFYFKEIKNGLEKEGTRLIKMNRNGKTLNEINTKNRLFKEITYQNSNFYVIGNNEKNKLHINDTITISKLFKDKLIPQNRYISDFDTFNIKSQITDSLGNIYWGGYVCNFETLGTIWSNHNDIYIAKFDRGLNLIWDYQFNQESIDKINDMVLINNKIYAIGESWFKNNGQIDKRMRLIIIEQKHLMQNRQEND